MTLRVSARVANEKDDLTCPAAGLWADDSTSFIYDGL